MKLRAIFTNWRVVLLLVSLLFAVIAIKPQILAEDTLTIKNVLPNSSSANAGIENPPAKLTPLAKERIVSINGERTFSLEDFYSLTKDIPSNITVRVETNKRIYTLLSKDEDSLGLRVGKTPTSNLRKGLDLEGGTRVLLKPQQSISTQDLETTIASLKERLNVFGLSDVVVRSASDLSGDDFILIEIAGFTEEEVQDLLARQGKFEAKIGNETVFFGGKKDITYVCRSADCSGIDPSYGCTSQAGAYACRFFFSMTLSADAAARQSRLTDQLTVVREDGNAYLSEDLILFLDDSEVDRLRIGAELKGRATTSIQISGSGSGRTESEALADTLESMKRLQTIIITGSLPVKLDVVKMDSISPALGKEFLDNILLVGLLVILAVIVVVMIRYRQIKIVVPMIGTLLSEMVLILGFAALVGWNLDLAGIAGILIVAGTGVDHLIVITDETLNGESIHDWKRRIKNAMFIVFGAYLTTLSGMLPLMWAGAGLLKGFALTTIAGISFGVLIARPAYAAIIEILLKD
jgi:preprotein translocase subunit SecD